MRAVEPFAPVALLVRIAMVALVAASVASSAHAATSDDPLFASRGSWGQAHDDQWALKRIGIESPAREPERGARIVVAVIDSGLDYMHPDLAPDVIWRNTKEQPNGRDDDGNGYVDDLIGWDFADQDNNPWDATGHGTHVAGVISASSGNAEGIVGVNPQVRIMPLRALNLLGNGRSTRVAQAIYYAVAQGARIINLSIATPGFAPEEGEAIAYAGKRGVLVVVAAGNANENAAKVGPAGYPGVITVAATGPDDRRVEFSNYGEPVDIAAPGVDVLSLRARRTDVFQASGDKAYRAGSRFVGPQARYYRATGTSFAAPFVSGVASLVWSARPQLSATDVRRIVLQSARDIEAPGVDPLTGFGLLDAKAALAADPAFFIEAQIVRVAAGSHQGADVLEVYGTRDADELREARLEYAAGETPDAWQRAGVPTRAAVRDGLLGRIAAKDLRSAPVWTLRVVAVHANGRERENRFKLSLK